MNITRRARGTEIQRHQQRVFLCWHTEDAERRDALVDDLLAHDAGADCVVSWLEDPADIDETLLRQELRETQLFVFLVTLSFLKQNKDEDAAEFRIAKELGDLPKLPVATDAGLFPMLTVQENAVHGIAMDDFEYHTKLRAQLDNFIASDELIKEIVEKAFTGRLFLSYRKVDIGCAHAFMKAFHDVPGFESIAIWYDNFLTAGRVFDEEICASIAAADVFVLLVTPNLLLPNAEGKTNYVLAEELPYAVKAGKKIVAVEAVKMDRGAFAGACPGVEIYLSMDELDRFEDYLPEGAVLEEMDAERAYLLGEALSRGIMTGTDYERGFPLMEKAALSGNAAAANKLADLCYHSENYHLSLDWLKLALEITIKAHGEKHADTATVFSAIGLSLRALAEYEDALGCHFMAMSIREKVLSKKHRDTALTYYNIAMIYDDQGNYDEALRYYFKALTIREKILGKEHPDTATTYNTIGIVCTHQGEYDAALEYLFKALAIQEKVFGKEHQDTALTYTNIGNVYKDQGKYEAALECYSKALAINEKNELNTLIGGSLNTTVTYGCIANLYLVQGRCGEAIEYLLKTLAIKEAKLGKEHPETAQAYNNIAINYADQGKYTLALDYFLKALAIKEKVLGKDHPDTASSYNNLGELYNRLGKYDKALAYHLKSLAAKEKVLGKEHPDTAISYNNIAGVYGNQGDHRKAAEYFIKALAINEKVFGKEHPTTVRFRDNLRHARQQMAISSGYSPQIKQGSSIEATRLNVQSIWDNATEGLVYDDASRTLLGYKGEMPQNAVLTVKIPTQKIAEEAFRGNTQLHEITLPECAIAIGKRAFSGCISLEKIIIPASVTSIGDWAFENCPNVTIITPIGSRAEQYAEARKITVEEPPRAKGKLFARHRRN